MPNTASSRQAIIRQLQTDANAHARKHAADVVAFQHEERRGRMMVLVQDVLERIVAGGDGAELDRLRVNIRPLGGAFTLLQDGRELTVYPRDDMSLMVGRTIVYPNHDCPVLERSCYDEIMMMILRWAREGKSA